MPNGVVQMTLSARFLADDLDNYTTGVLANVVIHELLHVNEFPHTPGHNVPTLVETRRNDPNFYSEVGRKTAIIKERYETIRGQCW